jgi:outer membrane protein assembly factor BamB
MGPSTSRELVNINPSGTVRWRSSFDDGWPMMPVTNGDLVVFVLREDWWMGSGHGGDGGPPGGGGGGPGGPGGPGGDPHADEIIVVGLDLATGSERWRTTLDGDMATVPQFAPDGSQIYFTARDMSGDGRLPGDPMHQGDAPWGGSLMTTSVLALDRAGNLLWSLDLSDDSP